MNGHDRRREQKKENIRRAAIELFKQHGIKRVRVIEIAAKANVSPVTIFKYFGNKQDLVRDVLKWLLCQSYEQSLAIVNNGQYDRKLLEQVILGKCIGIDATHNDFIDEVLLSDSEMKSDIEDFRQAVTKVLLIKFIILCRSKGLIRKQGRREAILLYMEVFRALPKTHPDLYGYLKNDAVMFHEFTDLVIGGLNWRERKRDLLPQELRAILDSKVAHGSG